MATVLDERDEAGRRRENIPSNPYPVPLLRLEDRLNWPYAASKYPRTIRYEAPRQQRVP